MISSIGGGLVKIPNKEFGSEANCRIFGIKPQNHVQLLYNLTLTRQSMNETAAHE